MPLTGLSDKQRDDYAKQLLDRIPNDRAIGNTALLRELEKKDGSWTQELYWAIRNTLINDGLLERGRGKGGSVRKASDNNDDTNAEIQSEEQSTSAENDLYEPMAQVIRNSWAPDQGFDPVRVEITAYGGRRSDGKWARPDVTLATYKTFPYVGGKHFDLITFEIKPSKGFDVTAVYEALAHRRAATRAYALIHVRDEHKESYGEAIEEITEEAKCHGVGIIVAGDPEKYETWEELVVAKRKEPDPHRLNEFLSKQVSQAFREQIAQWIR